MPKFLILVLIILCLGSCSWLKYQLIDIAYEADDWYQLQPAPDSDSGMSITQAVNGHYGNRYFSFLNQMEIDAQKMVLVGMGHMGSPVLNLVWDGRKLEATVSPLLQGDIHPGFLLRDMQLCFWPLETIRGGVKSPNWKIEESDDRLQRWVLFRDKKRIEIYYSSADHWQDTISFKHLAHGYSFQIETLVLEWLYK